MVSSRGMEERIHVQEETCFGHCQRGPNVLIYDSDETDGSRVYGPGSAAPASAVLYNRMTVLELERVVERHLVGGMVVRPFLNRPPKPNS